MKSGAVSKNEPRKRPTKTAAGSAVKKADRKRQDKNGKDEPFSPALRHKLARFLREEVTVVLTNAKRPPRVEGKVAVAKMPATTLHYASGGEPMAVSARVARALINLEDGMSGRGRPKSSLDDGADWRATFLGITSAALLESTAVLVECEDLRKFGSNTLSSVGNIVADTIRRTLLLWVLTANDWNMTSVGHVLRLGTASHVLRAIKDLGLTRQLDEAREKGLVKRGAPKKTGPKKNS